MYEGTERMHELFQELFVTTSIFAMSPQVHPVYAPEAVSSHNS
jgi:hypothetical protein